MKAKTIIRSCFLSAPFGVDTRALEQELRDRGFSVTDGRTIVPAAPVVSTIRKGISNADLVCVVTPSTLSANTAFEMGLAVGISKNVLVFAPLGSTLPSDVVGITYCSAALDDNRAIGKFLDAFLAHGRTPITSDEPSVKRHRLPPAEAKRMRGELAHASGKRFEQLVKQLFEASGFIAAEAGGPGEHGADFAVWVDLLQHAFGNPVIVEVKDRLHGQGLVEAEDTLLWGL
jgi:hypothetical protein